ncbi:hypothetical protein CCYN74_430018 [Capnocytophaga cynodegmi]|uniref:Right handed beta helix domain-containing protein n=2 Tax=Capnocytophaga cynodegmi TaxID=28189 RepID=A0A0B7HMN2_9FLAO|nr:hypothetical protein CCYN74_430018 [Capnocytophaga cynodegmi]
MKIANNILKRIDFNDGIDINYKEIVNYFDGTPMSDDKCDGLVYRKSQDGKYFKRAFDSTLQQNLVKKSMAEFRAITPSEILMLKIGIYKGVEVRGYYQENDTPKPIIYSLSTTPNPDDGGSIIVVDNNDKFEHKFISLIDARYFGANENQEDNSIFINKALALELPVHITGIFKIASTVFVNSNQFLIGSGVSNNRDLLPKSYLLKTGSFIGVELNGRNNGLKDFHLQSSSQSNLYDGILVRSARPVLDNVSSHNNGGDGIRIGDVKRSKESVRPNCNLFSLNNIYAVNNAGWGVHISDGEDNTHQDCNSGVFMLADLRNNTLGGLFINKANDNTLINISCQNNKGIGIVCAGRGNTIINCYTENNHTSEPVLSNKKDVHLTSSSVRNRFLFYYSGQVHDRVFDEGTSNFIIGTHSRIGHFFNNGINSNRLRLTGELSGVWNAYIPSNKRNLILELSGTSSNGEVEIKTQNKGKAKLSVDGEIVAETKLKIGGDTQGVEMLSGEEPDPNGVYTAPLGSIYIVTGNASGVTKRLWMRHSGDSWVALF